MDDRKQDPPSQGPGTPKPNPPLDELFPQVYERLRKFAKARLRGERRGRALRASDLVHETYLRLGRIEGLRLAGRTHLIALAARVMRQVLRDHAERENAIRRGGGLTRITLSEDMAAPDAQVLDVLALDEFLERMARRTPRRAKILEMKVFGGMTEQEMASELGVTERTVRSDLAAARARLAQFLRRGGGERHGPR